MVKGPKKAVANVLKLIIFSKVKLLTNTNKVEYCRKKGKLVEFSCLGDLTN